MSRRSAGAGRAMQPAVGLRPGDMNEDGAAAPFHPRPAIVIDLHHEIVEGIGAPQAVPGVPVGAPDRPVVATVGGILAPGVAATNAAHRQAGLRAPRRVGPKPQSDRAKSSARGRPVAFALEGCKARAPQRDRKAHAAGEQPTAMRTPPRPGVNPQRAPCTLPRHVLLACAVPAG
jgi:hypothetical protein